MFFLSSHLPWGIRCSSFIIHSTVFIKHVRHVRYHSEQKKHDCRWWGIRLSLEACKTNTVQKYSSVNDILGLSSTSIVGLKYLLSSDALLYISNKNWIWTTLLWFKHIPPKRYKFATKIIKANLCSCLRVFKKGFGSWINVVSVYRMKFIHLNMNPSFSEAPMWCRGNER